jgi:hypothetical protein
MLPFLRSGPIVILRLGGFFRFALNLICT